MRLRLRLEVSGYLEFEGVEDGEVAEAACFAFVKAGQGDSAHPWEAMDTLQAGRCVTVSAGQVGGLRFGGMFSIPVILNSFHKCTPFL